MLDVAKSGHASWPTICFQRASVIATDLLLVFALMRYGSAVANPATKLWIMAYELD